MPVYGVERVLVVASKPVLEAIGIIKVKLSKRLSTILEDHLYPLAYIYIVSLDEHREKLNTEVPCGNSIPWNIFR